MSTTESPFSITFRNGGGYDAYLFTVRGDTAEELEGRLDLVHEGLLQKVEDTALLAQSVHNVAAGMVAADSSPAQGNSASEPAQSQAKDNVVQLKTCTHGVREYRHGITKKGKNAGQKWEAWFCPEQDKNLQCEPIWGD